MWSPSTWAVAGTTRGAYHVRVLTKRRAAGRGEVDGRSEVPDVQVGRRRQGEDKGSGPRPPGGQEGEGSRRVPHSGKERKPAPAARAAGCGCISVPSRGSACPRGTPARGGLSLPSARPNDLSRMSFPGLDDSPRRRGRSRRTRPVRRRAQAPTRPGGPVPLPSTAVPGDDGPGNASGSKAEWSQTPTDVCAVRHNHPREKSSLQIEWLDANPALRAMQAKITAPRAVPGSGARVGSRPGIFL
jgi:hypothetical protein